MFKQVRFYVLKLYSLLLLLIGFISFISFALSPSTAKEITATIFLFLFIFLYTVFDKKSVLSEGYSVEEALSFFRKCVKEGAYEANNHQKSVIVQNVSKDFSFLKNKSSSEIMNAYRNGENIYSMIKIPKKIFFGSEKRWKHK